MQLQETNTIPVWTPEGELISEIKLPESIFPISTKRGGFGRSGIYYKGTGIKYCSHTSNEITPHDEMLEPTNILYAKYTVRRRNLVDKFGIFTFRYQPYFSDFAGGCGPKEAKVLENVKGFEASSVKEVVNVYNVGLNNHSIYALRYYNKRNPIALCELLNYIVLNDWNTAWDKGTYNDFDAFGYIRDIADWFKSKEFKHKLGTIYSILSSMRILNKHLFYQNLKAIGYYYEKPNALWISALLLRDIQPEIIPHDVDLDILTLNLHEKLLLEYVIDGKACCHLEFPNKWQPVKELFKKKYAHGLRGATIKEKKVSEIKCLPV